MTDFSINNIPFGIFSFQNKAKRLASIIDNKIIDLSVLAEKGYFDDLEIDKTVFSRNYLNDFIDLGKQKTNAVRKRLQESLVDLTQLPTEVFFDASLVTLHLPIKIGDYTDFYSSMQHAENVGKMFRTDNPLLPNWKHLPVAYHGRASSIFVSGTNFHRPKGQLCSDETQPPIFSATKRLDFELEVATIIGKSTEIGDSISVDVAEEYVFGFVLFNDWSARDIQRWEYVPLGPFLSKNFFSSISPWVVTIEALEQTRVAVQEQNPVVLPYLEAKKRQNFDINLEVSIIPAGETEETIISNSNFKYMYWTVAQQIAHHTVNGCNLNVGDLLASGTISGDDKESLGSLLEITLGGKNIISLKNNIKRTFLEDNDTIIIRGFSEINKKRIDFGEVRNTILPAKNN